jgi:hypothetical protein
MKAICFVDRHKEHLVRRRNIVMGAAVLFGVVVVAYLVSALWPAKVTIHFLKDQDGDLVVDLKPNWKVRSLYEVGFRLRGDDEYLWVIKPAPDTRRIIYGELPDGTTQLHPLHSMQPRPIPDTGTLYVRVQYRYDSTFPPAASISRTVAELKLNENEETDKGDE